MRRRTIWHNCQPIDLHKLARDYFLHAKRIELQTLARELGISRATAYRWAGSADQLVGNVLAGLVDDTFSQLVKRNDTNGGQRALDVLTRGMYHANNFSTTAAFFDQAPGTGITYRCLQRRPGTGKDYYQSRNPAGSGS